MVPTLPASSYRRDLVEPDLTLILNPDDIYDITQPYSRRLNIWVAEAPNIQERVVRDEIKEAFLDFSENKLDGVIFEYKINGEVPYTSLNLNDYGLTTPPPFDGLIAPIHSVFLCSNHFRKIPENAFQGLHDLRELRLSYNVIRTIDDHAFENLDQLKTVSLAYNTLDEINYIAFGKLRPDCQVNLAVNFFSGDEVLRILLHTDDSSYSGPELINVNPW